MPFFRGTTFLKSETLFHDFETGFLNTGTSRATERVYSMIMKQRSDILKHRSNILKLTVLAIGTNKFAISKNVRINHECFDEVGRFVFRSV